MSFGFLIGLTSQLVAKERMQVDIHELPKNSHALIGQTVTTHGCLTVILVHGDFVAPCGSQDWHESVLAYETDEVIAAVPIIASSGVVEGDFTGVVEELPITRPKSGKRIFVRIEKISNAKRYEP